MLPLSNSLYNIQRQYLELLGKIEEAEGEVTPEIEAALELTVGNMQEVGINIGQMVKTLEYWNEVVDKEINRLDGLKKKAEKTKDFLKERLYGAMVRFDIDRISSPTITISFRKSEAVEIYSETLIPPIYLDAQAPKISKTRIKDAIKSGRDVPGAEIIERKHLQIK